jgi:hypothetical protein
MLLHFVLLLHFVMTTGASSLPRRSPPQNQIGFSNLNFKKPSRNDFLCQTPTRRSTSSCACENSPEMPNALHLHIMGAHLQLGSALASLLVVVQLHQARQARGCPVSSWLSASLTKWATPGSMSSLVLHRHQWAGIVKTRIPGHDDCTEFQHVLVMRRRVAPLNLRARVRSSRRIFVPSFCMQQRWPLSSGFTHSVTQKRNGLLLLPLLLVV